MKRKLKNNRGETVVEVLASVLIAALSVALLFGAISASASMDRSAQQTDTDFYTGLSNAQAQTDPPVGSGTVTVSRDGSIVSKEISVNFYGGGGVLSYAPVPGGGAGS